MENKVQITLSGVQQTLLIPLWGRANAHRYGLPADPVSQAVIRQLDLEGIDCKIPPKLQIFMALRSLQVDHCVSEFLMEYPGAQVISLGSGLDGRCFRVSGFGKWTDVDYPDVIALRQELMKGMLTDRTILIGSSVTDSFWRDKMTADDGPVLIVMEGLLMYLHPGEIKIYFRPY